MKARHARTRWGMMLAAGLVWASPALADDGPGLFPPPSPWRQAPRIEGNWPWIPAPAPAPAKAIDWRTDSVKAYLEARDARKPLVLYLFKGYCDDCKGPCKNCQELERGALADPRVVAMADRAVFLRVDYNHLTPEEERSFKPLNIQRLPMVAVLDARPNALDELGTIIGAAKAEPFVARLSELMEAHARRHMATAPEAPPAPALELKPVPAPPVAFDGVLTPENLPAFLTNLGYEPKSEPTPGGAIQCTVTVRQGTWTIPVRVCFSKDRATLWLISTLTRDLASPERLPSAAMAELLEKNDEIGPLHFSIEKASRSLLLNSPFENRSVSPAAFRVKLEALVETIIKTEALWKAPNRALAAAPAPF